MQNLTRLFIFLFSSILFSQQPSNSNFQRNASMNFKVFGIISDSETGEPLEYATISIKSKNNPEKGHKTIRTDLIESPIGIAYRRTEWQKSGSTRFRMIQKSCFGFKITRIPILGRGEQEPRS